MTENRKEKEYKRNLRSRIGMVLLNLHFLIVRLVRFLVSLYGAQIYLGHETMDLLLAFHKSKLVRSTPASASSSLYSFEFWNSASAQEAASYAWVSIAINFSCSLMVVFSAFLAAFSVLDSLLSLSHPFLLLDEGALDRLHLLLIVSLQLFELLFFSPLGCQIYQFGL